MRLVQGPTGNLLLVAKSSAAGSLKLMGWEWSQVNAIRYDLEQVFGQNVFIAWDDS
jgi:thiamine kinase-like enzyme